MRIKSAFNDLADRRFSTIEPIIPIPPLLWEKNISINEHFLVDGYQDIYVQISSGQLCCYDKNGNQKWQTNITCHPKLYIDNFIYGTNTSWEYTEIYRIDSVTGDILNTYNIPDSPTCKGNGINAIGNNIFVMINNNATEWAKLGKIVDSNILIIADYTDIHKYGQSLTLDPERNRLLFICQNPSQDFIRIVVVNAEGSEIWRYPSLSEHWWLGMSRGVTDENNRAHVLDETSPDAYYPCFGVNIETPNLPTYCMSYDVEGPRSWCFKANGDFFVYSHTQNKTVSYNRDGIVRWTNPIVSSPKICSSQYLIVVEGEKLKILRASDGVQVDEKVLGWSPTEIVITANGYYCVSSSKLAYYASTEIIKLKYWEGTEWKTAKRLLEWDGTNWIEKHGKYWTGTEWKQYI